MIYLEKNTTVSLIIHRNDLAISGFGLIEIKPMTRAGSVFFAAIDSQIGGDYFEFQLTEKSNPIQLDGEFEMQAGIGNVWIIIYDEPSQTFQPSTEPVYKELGKM